MKLPRVMISAASSGSGKTLITCGLLLALKRKGLSMASFKCGPDYIDPMFHKTVLELPSRNLDSFFADPKTLRKVLLRGAGDAQAAVIEGVMGYYDGAGFDTTSASSYEIAKLTGTPVILILNAKGMSLSAAAVVKGLMDFREDSNIRGVILNNISKGAFAGLKASMENLLGIPVCGYVPHVPDCQLESRHLGLVTPQELKDIRCRLGRMADVLEETLDIDRILGIAEEAPEIEEEVTASGNDPEKIRIAIAMDEAFCFYYEDNLDLLRELGAELTLFSPIRDERIPEDCNGLILGGGYPELYIKDLSENRSMLSSVKDAIAEGMPCIAECGGFLYLHDRIEDTDHREYSMAGVIQGKGIYTGKLGRFGYINLLLQESQMFGEKHIGCKGHEFHYYDSTNNGYSSVAVKPNGKRSWECMHGTESLEAGFPHLYYESNPAFAENFIEKCREYRRKVKEKCQENC